MSQYSSDDISNVSLADFIVAMLFSAGSTRLLYRNIHEQAKKRLRVKERPFYQQVYRLKQKGIIRVSNGKVALSSHAREKYRNNHFCFLKIKPTGESRVLVLFDIPEKRRKIRNWLRDQLKEWDFELVQKSVWIGKGPLPKEFNERLGFFGVKEGIKVYPIHKKEK